MYFAQSWTDQDVNTYADLKFMGFSCDFILSTLKSGLTEKQKLWTNRPTEKLNMCRKWFMFDDCTFTKVLFNTNINLKCETDR